MSLIDSGWAAWLPFELTAALDALSGGSAARRGFRQLLAAERDEASRERWERFRLVAPSRVDVPIEGEGLTEADCYALLEGLGLVAGNPPCAVEAEAVELVLTLDEDDGASLTASAPPATRAPPPRRRRRCRRCRRPSAAATWAATIPAPAGPARSSSAATAASVPRALPR